MKVLGSFSMNHPILFVLSVTVIWSVSMMVLTGIASSALHKPYGNVAADAIGRLGVSVGVLLLIWGLGWLGASGIARLGRWPAWLLALGGMIYFTCASLYSLYGRVAFDWSLLRLPASQATVLRHLAVAVSEEVLFRGLVLYVLVRVWGHTRPGMIGSIAVTSLIFAGLHITQVFTHGASFAAALFLTLETLMISIWWGVLVLLGGSIWPAVVLHLVVNAAVAVQGLSVPMVEPNVLAYRQVLGFSIVLGALGIVLLATAAPKPV